jgi:MFS superfamily sulfate permease-like transporter
MSFTTSGCSLPIDLVIFNTCVFGTVGIWIVLAVVIGIISAIFSRK